MGELDEYLSVARVLTRSAGAKVMELLKDPLIKKRKSDNSIVTNADHSSNDILLEGIRLKFPKHKILSEESGAEGKDSDYVWVIDPLDGTRAYAKGIPGFSIMVGLLHRETPVLGIVYDPLDGYFYEAVKGRGSFCSHNGNTQKIQVTNRSEWKEMPVITSTGFPENLKKKIQKDLESPFVDPINSVGIKVGALVRQSADLYINHHPVHYWDTCAPQLILEEAGGVITSWDGSSLLYKIDGNYIHTQATVASNGQKHKDLILYLSGVSL